MKKNSMRIKKSLNEGKINEFESGLKCVPALGGQGEQESIPTDKRVKISVPSVQELQNLLHL